MKSNISEQALEAIQRGIERGDCIVDMELLKLPTGGQVISQRIINALEESEFGIITLERLMQCTVDNLRSIPNVGDKAITQIFHCLGRYHELEQLISHELTV